MHRRIAYFDCASGASGDMLLGALIDAGLDVEALRADLAGLGVSGYQLEAERTTRFHLAGTQVRVITSEQPRERRLSDIQAIIQASALSPRVRSLALAVFRKLAEAEATVHGTSVEDVHFHEVGALDAIVDIVGFAIGMERLGIEQAFASSLPLGGGMVETRHGRLPVPTPATLALLAQVHAPTRSLEAEAELLTPTGAAILTSVAEFTQPPMAIERIGTGFGMRELPWPNVLRVWLGTPVAGLETGEVVVIETNLDDCTPEQAGYAMERLFAAGALDVFFTPAQMKKNRPGVVLTVVAIPAEAHALARVVLRETTSLGVRMRTMERLMCPRRSETVATAFGPMQVKVKSIDGQDIVCPEYEECARVARERGVSLGEVYAEVMRSGLRGDEG
jgi:uncharacterized protein (TIGR00299 family) protein